jgi:hypothetical protein
VLKPGLDKSPRVTQPQTDCSRLGVRKFCLCAREFLFQVSKPLPKRGISLPFHDHIRAVANLFLDLLDASCQEGRLIFAAIQSSEKLLLKGLKGVLDNVRIENALLQTS